MPALPKTETKETNPEAEVSPEEEANHNEEASHEAEARPHRLPQSVDIAAQTEILR